MTQLKKKSWNAAVCDDDWGWDVLSRDFMYHFHQQVLWEMFSLWVKLFVVLLLRSQISHSAVSGHPIYRNLVTSQFKGSTCPCRGWLHFAKSTAGNFGQQWPLFSELISALPFSVLQEVTLFHVNKFVEKVWLFHLWPWAAAAELEQAGDVLSAKLWDCIIMAYTTAHTGKQTRDCYVGWKWEPVLDVFPANRVPAP